MKTLSKLAVCAALLLIPAGIFAWEPNAKDLDSAVAAGDFADYQAKLTAWLGQKVPAEVAKITEADLKALIKDPVVANALAQRQFISKVGIENMGKFAKADQDSAKFVAWILKDTAIMEQFLEGATPVRISSRDDNSWSVSVGSLEIWKKIYLADPDSRQGIYLRLAMATGLRPPGTGNRGAGMQQTPSDPLVRYTHFKTAHKNKELFPSFDTLTVWDYTHVVDSCASEADLAWGREMINTWQPHLRENEMVVNSTSEVWRRNSPHPFTDYKTVLSGGGKCGPRSSWGVFIGQAFGIPSCGVGQPAHACIAARAAYPDLEPQKGSPWKVYQGRGWEVSRLEGMSGGEFIAGVEERYRVASFTQVEHLRWLAAAMVPKEQSEAVMGVARKIQQAAKSEPLTSPKGVKSEAKKEPVTLLKEPVKLGTAATRVEASAISGMSGVSILDCYTGGKQLNFYKNVESSWAEYTFDVPAAGNYQLVMKMAAANLDQVLDISVGTNKLATVKVPYTTGLWGTSEPVELKLEKGVQTMKISSPFQRAVAIRWLELTPGK